MTTRLTLSFTKSEGALIRLIGMVERKGWEVCAISMDHAEQDGTAEMTLTLTPRDETRSLEVLCRHIEKMHDVSAVAANSAVRILEQN